MKLLAFGVIARRYVADSGHKMAFIERPSRMCSLASLEEGSRYFTPFMSLFIPGYFMVIKAMVIIHFELTD